MDDGESVDAHREEQKQNTGGQLTDQKNNNRKNFKKFTQKITDCEFKVLPTLIFVSFTFVLQPNANSISVSLHQMSALSMGLHRI